MNAQMNGPYLEITVQPINQFHFRYETEMKEFHGFLTGQKKKTFPTVCLRNFKGQASIRCSLYQMPKPGNEALPHSHSLVVHDGTDYIKDPHDVIVSQIDGYQATFTGMRIINRKVNEIKDELFEKFAAKQEFERGHLLTPEQKNRLQTKAQECSKNVNLNQVVLCFEAYAQINGRSELLCAPVFSTPINEKRNASYGELKIDRISTMVGRATGGEDVFLFVKKVDKNNIKVRFYEQNDSGEEIWDAWGEEVYVHYQFAIALKTPSYRGTNNKENVKVFIQLYRKHDHATSEPIEFRYKHCNTDNTDGNRKRPRTESSSGYDTDATEVAEQSPQHCPQFTNHQQQNHDFDEELCRIWPEFKDPNFVQEFITWFENEYNNSNDHNMLAKDSISAKATDDKKFPELQRKVEKFVLKFLELPLLKCCNADDHEFHIVRKLCAYIFGRAVFKGENTMAHLCVKSNDRTLPERFLEILHKFKLDDLLNLRNYNQETCVHLACAMNKVNVLQKLMEYGADVNVFDCNGNRALHLAIQNESNDCVSTLLNTTSTVFDRKIDIDLSVFNDSGFTPLHLAVMKNNLHAVEMLTHKAIKTQCLSIFDDMDDKHGHTALHLAIQSNAHEIAEYLIKNECISPLKMNRSGHTALDLARDVNAIHLVDLMEQYATVNDENFMNNIGNYDDSDHEASSYEEKSVKLQDANEETSIETAKSLTGIDKLTKSDEEIFDEKCLAELSDIFDENDKWKLIANDLGYQSYIERWQKSPKPTKVLLKFSEVLKVSKDRLVEIFQKLDEKRAIQCIHEYNNR